MSPTSRPYSILPIKFSRINDDEYLIVNEAGEFMFIDRQTLLSIACYKLKKDSEAFFDLKSKHFVTDTDLSPIIELLATKLRSKKAFLKNFTVLHMIVLTSRCNHRCTYCQASSQNVDALSGDMTPEVARKVVDIIFQAPSHAVKIEFQGGEPLLNWRTIQEIVSHAEKLSGKTSKSLEFVLCTNLTLMDKKKLSFIKDHNILVSTSLDGPQDLHDKNRILRAGGSSYAQFMDKLSITRATLGNQSVSALMTCSVHSLSRMKDIVNEYVRYGFNGIFLRSLNPFGYARTDKTLGYTTESFVDAYKECLSYIIELNLQGTYFEEYYTSLLLSRILTPFSTGFMDLQSPTGAGICGAIYDRNGDVYPCDEARMLAMMGDKKFLLGNVLQHSFVDIFGGRRLVDITYKSCVEIMPGCASCVYQLFCGADPIRNYVERGDIIGHRPTSSFCKKNKAIFDHLFGFLKDNNNDVMDVFWSWITRRSLKDLRNVELPR